MEESKLIPKIIHYCWFVKNKKSSKIKKCIKSWKKYFPDYKIIEWNEDNFDISSNEWCKSAYEAKKWAFVTDYVRLKVLKDYGGIYMDTDVELIQSLDPFLQYHCFMGFQHEKYVSNGLVIGAVKNHGFIIENAAVYENIQFETNEDSYKLKVCQEYTTELLANHGLTLPCDGKIQIIDDIYIFPPEYFCPYDHRTYEMNKTENTVAIHHFASSWWDKNRKNEYKKQKCKVKINYYIHFPHRVLLSLIGEKNYNNIKKKIKGE